MEQTIYTASGARNAPNPDPIRFAYLSDARPSKPAARRSLQPIARTRPHEGCPLLHTGIHEFT